MNIEETNEFNDELVSENEELDSSTQSRRWFLTINNPTETDEEMCNFLENLEHFKYSMFQREKGHIEGTIHFQIFLIFTIGKRFSTIKNLFPRAHIEKAQGSNVQCRDYCSKTDTRISGPYELGVFAEQRSRTDLVEFMSAIEGGLSDKELRKMFPSQYFRYQNNIDRLRQQVLKENFEDVIREMKVTYIYGDTGSGKSFAIHSKYKAKDLYVLNDYHRDSWYSYNGQKVVLFEEFHSDIRLNEMLRYLDCYAMELPARYSNKIACYDTVFITSNLPLSAQYKNTGEDNESKRAFYRRIHNVLHFTNGQVFVEKCRDETLSEIKQLLPDYLAEKLVLKNFEQVLTNSLPFSEEEQLIIDEIF